MSNFHKTARRIVLAAAALLPLVACAGAVAPGYWQIEIQEASNRPPAARALRYSWGDIAHVNRLGSKDGVGLRMSTYEAMPSAPLQISWIDSKGTQHEHAVPVKTLLSGRDIYSQGGGIRVLIEGDVLSVVAILTHKTTRDGRPWVTYSEVTIFSTTKN